MPRRVVDPIHVPFIVTTPAGTQPGTPVTTALDVEAGILEVIDLLIPAGHAGQTGIRFALAGQQVLPWSNTGAWIIGESMRETFALDVEVDTQLTAITYNRGLFDHSHYVTCRVRRVQPSSGLPRVTLASADELGSA